MQIVFAKDGNTVDYDIMVWSEAMAEVRIGKFNAAVGIADGDSIEMIHTVTPQSTSYTCGFALNSSTKTINNAKDLIKFKSIGIIKDYTYGVHADKVLTSMKKKVIAISSDDALAVNIRRLLDGKIELLVDDPNVISYQLKNRKITNIKKLGCTEDKNYTFIGFTKSNPKSKGWVEILSKGQAELEKSGRMSEIFIKYGIDK
jgi:polar amino acid transport system substrate-binding protein